MDTDMLPPVVQLISIKALQIADSENSGVLILVLLARKFLS